MSTVLNGADGSEMMLVSAPCKGFKGELKLLQTEKRRKNETSNKAKEYWTKGAGGSRQRRDLEEAASGPKMPAHFGIWRKNKAQFFVLPRIPKT